MNKKEVIICIVMIVAFFILANYFKLTGFAVIDSGVEVDQEVVTEATENGEVDVIVKLKEDNNIFIKQEAKPDEVLENLAEGEFEKKHEFEDGFSGEVTLSGLNKLKTDLNVERIELNHPMQIFLQDSINIMNASTLHGVGITGSGKSVCVVDTGVAYNHPDLAGKYLGGYDFFNNDPDPYDDHGHGTHVCGIIAANGGVVGIAKGANLVVVKVVDANGVGSEADIIKGIEYCTAHKDEFNIATISLSLGTSSTFTNYCDNEFISLAEAINNAVANGIIVVAASGNAGSTTGISSPACIQNAVAVGATTKADAIATYSNRNALTDLLAPGSYITSLWLTGTKTLSGTSMSTPHVSAAVALLRSYNASLTNEDVINALKSGKIITDGSLSLPRVDVYKAYLSLDKTMPIINIVEPESNATLEYTTVLFNITSDENLANVILEIDNANESMLGLNNNFYLSKNLKYGNHDYRIYGNDLSGNIGATELRNLFINVRGVNVTYNPLESSVNINEPENQTFSAIGENLTISWYLDNTNVGAEGVYNYIGNYNSAGNHNVTVYVNSEYNTWNLIVNNTNRAPVLNESIPNQEWNENTNLALNLNNYFIDLDGNSLTYTASNVENISITLNGSVAALTPSGNFSGTRNAVFTANDGQYSVESNSIGLTVKNLISCGDSLIEGSEECDSWNLNGKTCIDLGYDSGNLTCNSCMFDLDECTNTPAEESEDEGGSGGGGGGGGGIDEFAEDQFTQEEIIEPAAPSEELEKLFETTSETPQEEVKEEPEQKVISGMTSKEGLSGSWIALIAVTLIVIVGIIVFRKFSKRR